MTDESALEAEIALAAFLLAHPSLWDSEQRALEVALSIVRRAGIRSKK